MVDMATGCCVYDTSFMLVLVSIISSHLISSHPGIDVEVDVRYGVFVETLMSRIR